MPVTRRGFMGALAAALVLDPERALWVPGKKLISIPRPPRERHMERMHFRQGQNFMPQAIAIHEGRAEDCARCNARPFRGDERVGDFFTIAAVNLINPPR